MPFEFATANRILFGPGTLQQVGALAKPLGNCALVITGQNAARAEPLLAQLKAAGVATVPFRVGNEPATLHVRAGIEQLREELCDLVVAFGGGSVIDAAKAIAGIAAQPGELLDYLEVVGRGQPLANPSLPVIAIPTTAGTGAEVTRNAVLASPEHRVKASVRSPHLLPRVALVDPELTLDLPPALTASTGMDALTQLIEPYVCPRANPMTVTGGDGAVAGFTTSANFGHTVGKPVVFGYVPVSLLDTVPDDGWTIEVYGEQIPAVRHRRALHDPGNARLKA
mgnify:CR=1 FL=1